VQLYTASNPLHFCAHECTHLRTRTNSTNHSLIYSSCSTLILIVIQPTTRCDCPQYRPQYSSLATSIAPHKKFRTSHSTTRMAHPPRPKHSHNTTLSPEVAAMGSAHPILASATTPIASATPSAPATICAMAKTRLLCTRQEHKAPALPHPVDLNALGTQKRMHTANDTTHGQQRHRQTSRSGCSNLASFCHKRPERGEQWRVRELRVSLSPMLPAAPTQLVGFPPF
jgi:hypothetical protein